MDERMYKANVKLVDENSTLKKDIEILEKRIKNAIEFIRETEEYYSDGVNEELIDILKGEQNE